MSRKNGTGETKAILPQAVIMAGGKGVRLRPLTLDTPKPLQPLLNKPTIIYIFELLKRHGYQKATITTGYRAEQLKESLSDYTELAVSFVKEEEPLGTAGGVRFAWDGKSDVLVLSGDGLCDFDLTEAWNFFKEHGCDALLVTRSVDDPREYGLVETAADGRILSFKEKPAFSACSCDTANTGVYILSSRVLNNIKKGDFCDFGSELFPKLLKDGSALYALPQNGYWCDIGDIDSYIRCQADLLNGKIASASIDGKRTPNGFFADTEVPHEETVTADAKMQSILPRACDLSHDYKLIPPVYMGSRVKIGAGSVIGPNTVIGDDAVIGASCEIAGSIIGRCSVISDGAVLERMVCGELAAVGENARCESGSVLGSRAILGDNAVLTSGIRVFDGLEVENGFILRSDLIKGRGAPIRFDEDGISGLSGVVITPQLCASLGSGVAALCEKNAVGIGYSEAAVSKTFYHAIASGVTAAGENAWCFGALPLSQFEFCMHKSGLSVGVYIEGGRVTTLRLLSKTGLPLSRRDERKLEAALNHSEYRRAASCQAGSITDLHGLKHLYHVELLKVCDAPLSRFTVRISCRNEALRITLTDAFWALSARVADSNEQGVIAVTLSPDGKQVSIKEENGVSLSHEQLVALCCLFEFKRSEDVALPCKAPAVIDELAKAHGRTLYRYAECPCGDEDAVARQKAASKPYLRDGILLLIKVLSSISAEGLSLSSAAALLPPFVTTERVVSFAADRSDKTANSDNKRITALLRELQKTGSETAEEGFTVRRDGKSAYLRPLKSGRGIMVYTQGSCSAQACETADFFEALLKEI